MNLNQIEKKRHCRVNRTVRIDSLASKDRCGGFHWQALPAAEELGKHEVSGGFEVRELVKISDVDGVVKQVLKTAYLDAEGGIRKKAAFGVYQGDGWRFHGGKSRNWKAAQLTAEEIIGNLNDGWSVTPGRFTPEKGQSHRSAETLQGVDFLLMDGDEWSDACPPPTSIGELRARFPNLESTFYWIGESISSRSALKPEMRFRLLALFPEEIPRTELGRAQFLEIIESLLQQFPFLARGPSTDMVRLAYGNGRLEKVTATFGACLSAERLATAQERAKAAVAAREQGKTERAERAERRRAVSATSVRGAGAAGASNDDDPLQVFLKRDIRGLLEQSGFSYLRTTAHGEEYHFKDSGQGRSCLVSGDVLKPFSNSLQKLSPDGGKDPVNVHRFLLWFRYDIDFKGIKGPDMAKLKEKLAADGFGVYEKPRRRRRMPPMLRLSSDRTPVRGESLDAVRAVLQQEIERILAEKVDAGTVDFYHVGADTGSGKTHTILANAGDLLFRARHGTKEQADEAMETLNDMGRDGLLFCAPHGDLADEAMKSLIDMEITGIGRVDVFRWFSRWHGFKEGFEACGGDREKMEDLAFKVIDGKKFMCPFADLAEALVQKGRMPGGSICLNCALREDCDLRGYRSQYFEALASAAVFIALPEMQLILDGDWKELSERIGKERLAIIDDVAVWELGVRRAVSQKTLTEMLAYRDESWSDGIQKEVAFKKSVSSEFLTKLHTGLVGAGEDGGAIFAAMQSAYTEFKAQWKRILWELSRTPIYLKFHCVDPMNDEWEAEDADHRRYPVSDSLKDEWGVYSARLVRTGVWKRYWVSDGEIADMRAAGYERMADVQRFKPISKIGTGWAASLGKFIEGVGDGANAPVSWLPKSQEWEWFVEPLPNFEKTVYLSATADEGLVRKMITAPKVRVQSVAGAPLAWEQGSEIFQLATGRMTEASFFERAHGEIVGAGPRLADMCALIEKQIALGDKVVLVGLKALQDAESLSAVLSPIRDNQRVTILNYGEVVGLNEYADSDMIFLMLPEPSPGELAAAARRLYRADKKPLKFDRVERTIAECGVKVRKRVYVDQRVSAVHAQIIRQKMYQGAMRLRPMLLKNKKIILLTSEPVPGLTDREITLFTWEQALAEADIRDVGKSSLQTDLQASVRDGEDLQVVSETLDVSEKTVRRAGGSAKSAKARRNERIHAAAGIGMSLSEIAAEEGISRRQVGRILKG